MTGRGRPRSFDRKAALRRAMNLFWERGYEATSLSDLTTAMGISSPSLYAAFGCKEALFREAAALYSATEALLRISAQRFTRPGKPHGCFMVLAAVNCAADNDAVRRHLAKYRSGVQAAVRRRLQRAIAEGELPAGFDARAAAAFYVTVQNGLSLQARDGVPRARLDEIVDCAMAAWDGLLRPPVRRRSSRSLGTRDRPKS